MSAEEVATAPAVEKPEDVVASDQAEQAEQVDGEVAEEPKAVSSMSPLLPTVFWANISPSFDDSSASTGSWPYITETYPRRGLFQFPNLRSEP
jgi:hypothetical protein